MRIAFLSVWSVESSTDGLHAASAMHASSADVTLVGARLRPITHTTHQYAAHIETDQLNFLLNHALSRYCQGRACQFCAGCSAGADDSVVEPVMVSIVPLPLNVTHGSGTPISYIKLRICPGGIN